MTTIHRKEFSETIQEELIKTLKNRFDAHMHRHKHISWDEVVKKLNEETLYTLHQMESTGGEPDVMASDQEKDKLIFCDWSKETPLGRRNLCYDTKALEARKKFPPQDSAMNVAKQMGIEMLDEAMYFQMQQLESFDLKTSSWLKTPKNIRDLGGAIFGDRRYDTVFIYHNGADSYYGVRGFRGYLSI